MPGILPMKVIKVGTSAQSRIAQACDRCRSKKIRCDGVTPCCSQCANVGFECKTSDKLSRRAFPRGYTESLEERVRALESEVRELKDLLDEKDETIDMLARIRSSSPRQRKASTSSNSVEVQQAAQHAHEDIVKVQQTPFLVDERNSNSYFTGASTGRAFINSFKGKLQESGRSSSDFDIDTFLTSQPADPDTERSPIADSSPRAPPRLVSDQLINVYFQEWAPLFPILHRPTFLDLYSQYVSDPKSICNLHDIAQLNLVFAIAAVSAESIEQDAKIFQAQWQPALNAILAKNTIPTLQCLLLAQIFSLANGDYSKLSHYNGIAVSLSYKLGLHLSQKRFSLGALTSETRKKVFWTSYTLDCFSASILGLPKLMRDENVHTEYPSDIDDENVTERGFQSTLPGEFTRLSSALALFRASRILSKVLNEVYSSSPSYDLSLQRTRVLSDDLDAWLNGLAPHLRLHFAQDKPSTNVTSSRSPLLSLTYHYIRSLIYRPVLCSTIGQKISSFIIPLAESSKRIIQIVQLLEERRLSFSFCANKNDLLTLSGFGILFQCLDLDNEGKLARESQKLIRSTIEILECNKAPCAHALESIACSMAVIKDEPKTELAITDISKAASRSEFDKSMPAPRVQSKSTRKQLQAFASRFSFGSTRAPKQDDPSCRRATFSTTTTSSQPASHCNNSQLSVSSTRSEPPLKLNAPNSDTGSNFSNIARPLNLDYLSFSNDPIPTLGFPPVTGKHVPPLSSWEEVVEHSGTSRHGCDSSTVPPDLLSYIDISPSMSTEWSPDSWTSYSDSNHPAPAPSVPSISEESLISGDEFANPEFGIEFRGIAMPNVDDFGGYDSNCGL